YQQAISAYIRAFEVLPTAHRGFGEAAFSLLRHKLFTSVRYLRAGYSEGRVYFHSWPALRGDSIEFIPAPASAGRAVRTNDDVTRSHQAVRKLQSAFHDIASG